MIIDALVIEKIGQTAFHAAQDPAPDDGEVLPEMRHIGLCGSHLATFTGLNPLVRFPRIRGHEIGATKAQAGRDVPANFAPRRRVIDRAALYAVRHLCVLAQAQGQCLPL